MQLQDVINLGYKVDGKVLAGFLLVRKLDSDGNLIQEWMYPNVVTTIGKQRCASHLANSSPGKTWFTHIALSTNTDAVSTEDLALDNEFYREALDTVFAADATVFGSIIMEGNDIGAGTTWTVYKVGLLDAASGGNLICQQLLGTAVEFEGTEKLEILWGVIVT